MTLTGGTFWWALVIALVISMAGTLFLWERVRGVGIVRFIQRLAMIIVCQLTAVSLVATWVNNSFGLYASWSDLLGTDNSGALVMAGPPPKRATFSRSEAGTVATFFRGTHSRLAGEVYVWTPPQYSQPAYRNTRFPVIELLHGAPGDPRDWLTRGRMPQTIATMIAEHRMKPAIVVVPEITPGGVSTDCSNVPGIRGADWLAKDVPVVIKHHFRTLSSPRAWALVGISTGGFCALKLPMQFPKVFGIGAGMDSDQLTGDPTVLTSPALRSANAPVSLAKSRPPVQLFAATTAQDRSSPPSNITALQQVIRQPTTLAPPYVLQQGGHNWGTWARMEPALFTWLDGVLQSPQGGRR